MSTPIEQLRKKCLERGVNGIRQIGRMFRMYDRNSDVSLDKGELELGLERYGLKMSKKEVDELFWCLDKDGNGAIDFDELLVSLRPPMSKARLDIIEKAFRKLDKTGDGKITMMDIKGNYSKPEQMQQFLDTFQAGACDEEVTKEEFVNYYSGVSASVDNDDRFVCMLTNDWKL